MSDGINTDKVIVNAGSGGGGSDMGSLAALMMASRGDDSQSNIWASILPALTNQDRGGMNNMWPLLLLFLLKGRGGFGDGGGDCGVGGTTPAQAAILQTLMEGQSDLRAQVPTVGLETQNAIQNAIAQFALGTQQGFSNVKDSVQNGIAFLDRDIQNVNQNVSAQGCQTREYVSNDGDKTRFAIADLKERVNAIQENNLQRELAVAQSLLSEERQHRHSDGVEVRVSQTVNQVQAQAQQQQQQQQQFAQLFGLIGGLANQIQVSRQAQDIVNLGTMTASGTQAAANTQVR